MSACKGGGEGDQETIHPNQDRKDLKEESVQRRGGEKPCKIDPWLQLSENQQETQNSDLGRRQWRPRNKMALNYIMAGCTVVNVRRGKRLQC
ncbi:MAG: hypothetical protein GY696_08990 [Gammaproteobacteria bacterium]|nr:hypothetical protein [Gammaproteobacteria bacterium]